MEEGDDLEEGSELVYAGKKGERPASVGTEDSQTGRGSVCSYIVSFFVEVCLAGCLV